MALNIVLVTGTREKMQMAAMIAAVSAVSDEMAVPLLYSRCAPPLAAAFKL